MILIFVGYFEIWIAGTHGQNFEPASIRKKLSYAEKQTIANLDSFGQSLVYGMNTCPTPLSFLGNTTAKRALAIISTPQDTAPSMDAVTNRLKVSRRKIKKKSTDLQQLEAIFKAPQYKRFVLYENIGDYDDDTPLIIVLTTDFLIQKMKQFCQFRVGIDAGWKWTHKSFPCWVLSGDLGGHGFTGAFIITNNGSASVIQDALEKIVEKMGDEWKPVFMLDHDAAIRKALIALDFKFNLCWFHSTKELGTKLESLVEEYGTSSLHG